MSQNKASLKDRLTYAFENTLSAGTIALIGWLAVASLLIVIVAALLLTITGLKPQDGESYSFAEAAWQSLMRVLDSGAVGADTGWPFRAVMLLVTVGGIFIVSTLIGVLNAGLEGKIDELRKGRSRVLEQGHTLILGWSPKVFPILSELIIANANQKKPRIVILADKDKVEMEDEIRAKIADTLNTRIICRTGSPLEILDLEVANPNEAASIIIVSPEEENADTHVIKSVLALTNHPKRKRQPFHIVAEIQDEDNLEAAELVGNGEAVYVLSADLISRVTAQTCRQSGISVVYTELLDYNGAEIYFKREDALTGKTFREALFAYEDSAVIGYQDSKGYIQLNPRMDTVLEKGGQIIAVSQDDDTIRLSGKTDYAIAQHLIRQSRTDTLRPERTLILGWNQKGNRVIRELDAYVAPGSGVTVLTSETGVEEVIEALKPSIIRQKITVQHGDMTRRAVLESMEVQQYNHLIILSQEGIPVQEADARTLICLLHLRNLAEKYNRDFSIVSEMLDIRNRTLAEVTKADDFIVGDRLISLLLTQYSQNRHLKAVFDELFSAEGCEIYLKPAGDYVATAEPINFYTVLQAAALKNQTAIGYRVVAKANDSGAAYGIVLNPVKSNLVTFQPEDKIIVLSED